MKILNIAFANFIHFLYPTYCLHCDERVLKPHHLLCLACFQQIEWINYRERCPRCLSPKRCKTCVSLRPHRSLFESEGPILALYQEFLKTKRGKGLASLIAFGLARDVWPLPEMIVPLIDSPFPKQDPLWALAKELAILLNAKPSLLGSPLENKTVLLLVGMLCSSKELLKARQTLSGYFPEKIFTVALIDQR